MWHILLILFIYLWLCWVFVSVRGLSLVAASGGHSSSRCVGLSLSRPLLLRSTGSRRAGSVIVAHGPSCSAACGIFPDRGSNPCPLHWQAESQPLRHEGSPHIHVFNEYLLCFGYFRCIYCFHKTVVRCQEVPLRNWRQRLARAQGLSQSGHNQEGAIWQPYWDPLAEVPAFPWLASYNFGCFSSCRVLAAALDDKVEHMPSISLCPSSIDLL